jgi:hypothetical protein
MLLRHVKLLEGEQFALNETYQLRHEFVQTQRQQRDARRQRVDTDHARRAAGKAQSADSGGGVRHHTRDRHDRNSV